MKFCESCNKNVQTNIIKKKETYSVKGTDVTVIANVMVCAECGEEMFNEALDQATLVSVFEKYNETQDKARENKQEKFYVHL